MRCCHSLSSFPSPPRRGALEVGECSCRLRLPRRLSPPRNDSRKKGGLFAIDVEDFVQKYVFGIEDANGPEIELDKEFERRMILESENIAEEIMDKDVSDWSVDDFNFIRGTIGYHKNWERRRKVLDFLNYNNREKQ